MALDPCRPPIAAHEGVALPHFPEEADFAFLDDSLQPGDQCTTRLFFGLRQVIECKARDQVARCFQQLSEGLAKGLFAVGLFNYELGHCFEAKLTALERPESPPRLFTVLLFEKCLQLTEDESAAFIERNLPPAGPAAVYDVHPTLSKDEYCRAIRRIKEYVREGDVYQVNFTFKYLFRHLGNPLALYAALRARQRVQYGAYIRTPGVSVLSFSPELFLRKCREMVTVKPMKGTVKRGANASDDALLKAELQNGQKNRAENLMIVDLLRNDLGRVAELGTVRVDKLFEIETYETLFQMTSTISAKVDLRLSLHDLFAALYPCGSVTGAPKIRAMEIINELEAGERGLYTGAIGYMLPDGDCCFNVAIRTLVLDENGTGEMGIGSGITFDSDENQEYEECILKGRFLTGADPGFRLIESLYCHAPASFRNLELHLQRLRDSSNQFLFQCDTKAIRDALLSHASSLSAGPGYKTRLLLNKDGIFEIESAPLPSDEGDISGRFIMFSDKPTDSKNCLLYHKTTARHLYDSEYARVQKEHGCYEVIFCNERGEVTEGSRTNVFVQKDGKLYTSPVSCGLLNGVMRRLILQDPRFNACERVLRPDDLVEADRVFVTNSVRGIVEVKVSRTGIHPRAHA